MIPGPGDARSGEAAATPLGGEAREDQLSQIDEGVDGLQGSRDGEAAWVPARISIGEPSEAKPHPAATPVHVQDQFHVQAAAEAGGSGLNIAGEAPLLHSYSQVKDLRKRLKELGAPQYGDRALLWSRLLKAEAQRRRDIEIAKAIEEQIG